MSILMHVLHAAHAVKHGIEDDDHVTGSMKVGFGGAVGAAAVATALSAPVSLPLLAVGAGVAAVARVVARDFK